MATVHATWKNGQVVLDTQAEWPEGHRLVVREALPADIEFMTEGEQSSDSSAVQRWIDELRSVPALPMTPEQEAEMLAWRQRAHDFNLEAVRRQMQEGIG